MHVLCAATPACHRAVMIVTANTSYRLHNSPFALQEVERAFQVDEGVRAPEYKRSGLFPTHEALSHHTCWANMDDDVAAIYVFIAEGLTHLIHLVQQCVPVQLCSTALCVSAAQLPHEDTKRLHG